MGRGRRTPPTGHEHGRPRPRARAAVSTSMPPSTSSAVPSREQPAQPADLADRAREEPLAAPARVHRHAEDQVDVLDQLAHDLGRRAGVERQAGAAAGVAHRGERVVGVRRGLEVDRDPVGARVGEGGDVALGPLDHEVDVDVAAGVGIWSASAETTGRAHAQRGHEVAVHDVDVDRPCAGLQHEARPARTGGRSPRRGSTARRLRAAHGARWVAASSCGSGCRRTGRCSTSARSSSARRSWGTPTRARSGAGS